MGILHRSRKFGVKIQSKTKYWRTTVKKIPIFLLVLISFFAGSLPIEAGQLTGRDIALKMDAVDTSLDSKRTAIMVINRKGQKLIRKMESFTKKYGPDERGRRISGGGKKGSFMRSDFANEDIEKSEVDDDEHRLLRSEELSGVDCYVVERITKKQKDTNYSKRIVWVRKDTWLPMKIEYYNKRSKHFKTAIYGGFKDIKGIWTITKIMAETPHKGSKTLMQYDNVDYNIGLSDALFEQSNLKR
jgi:hypothetical protein